MTSFYRKQFTEKTVQLIHERTIPGTFQIHIFDNGSDKETRDFLYGLLDTGKIASLHLDSRNTGCLYNKGVFHIMTEVTSKYYIVTDNDIYPPKLDPDWLTQILGIMEEHPELAFLTPQLPPVQLQMPYQKLDDIIYCKAVGNTFKVVRREAFPLEEFKPQLMKFGDDGWVSDAVHKKGWKVAFCKDLFCWHAGQCENWGYTKQEELDKDPRKAGYGAPFIYQPNNELTYEPPEHLRF